MPRGDRFYVINFRTPDADGGGSEHYEVMQLDAAEPIGKYLRLKKIGYPQLDMDVDQKAPAYDTQGEAIAEARRLGDIAQQANPDRIGAETVYPAGEANRILEVGRPGSSPPPNAPTLG